VAPKLLSDDDEGFVPLRDSSMEITDEQQAHAEEAVAAGPERAITLTRDS
jgi:ferredoxin